MKTEGQFRIRIEGLNKTYRSGPADVQVFAGLECDIAAGERVAVIGESGAGKSTLLYLLGALDRPTSGRILYGDSDIFSLDDTALADFRNRTIGFVWQMNSLLPEFTALENVAMPLLIRGADPEAAHRIARQRLEEVGLKARVDHRPGELSGGEQQRVAMARALAAGPKALLADEPTGNLDHKSGESISRLLAEVHRAHRLTSVIVTHNLSLAESCDRVLQLDQGVFVPWTGSESGSSVR
ncbi:MAG: ABC transporter ATP-binding protein [Bryobacteraceae bacterium]